MQVSKDKVKVKRNCYKALSLFKNARNWGKCGSYERNQDGCEQGES